jgi:hypothetical protein
MQALRPEHRGLIARESRRCIIDSLEFDLAMRREHETESRWDYLASIKNSREPIGIEPHTASSDHEITSVIRKKTWSEQLLRSHLESGVQVREWFWVSSGNVRFSRMERASRRLDQAGITFAGRLLRLRDCS